MATTIHLTLLALVWIAVVTSAILWTKFLYRCSRGSAHPSDLFPAERRRRPFWTLADFLVAFGALLIGLLILTSVFTQQGWMEPAVKPSQADEGAVPSLQSLVAGIAANSLAGIFAVIVTMLWLSLLNPKAIRQLGLVPQGKDILLGLRAALWILPPVGLISLVVSLLIPYEHPVLDTLAQSPSVVLFAGMFVGTAIVAPFVEEFMFRVILQGGLEGIADGPKPDATATIESPVGEAYLDVAEPTNVIADAYRPPREILTQSAELTNTASSTWAPTHYWPMVVTSIVFASMHYGQGAAPIPLFVLSLGLGYLYRQTGRITAPLVVHMVLNTITLCAEFTRILAGSLG